METDWLLHPFTLGCGLGLLFAIFATYRLLRTKSELNRYKRHLSDKLEIEADVMKRLKTEKEELQKINENLRMKVSSMNELPDRRAARDLEVYARAEKQLVVTVPGFAGAWEKAKHEAQSEVEEEEAGNSVSRRVFTKLFGTTPRRTDDAPAKMLPESAAPGRSESGPSQS